MARRTIGRLAKETGVSVETIRFYEQQGLLRRPPAPPAGWREYGEDTVWLIRYIKLAQRLGFSLSEVKRLMARLSEAANFCEGFRGALADKVREIEEKIEQLTEMKKDLETAIANCRVKSAAGRRLSACAALRQSN